MRLCILIARQPWLCGRGVVVLAVAVAKVVVVVTVTVTVAVEVVAGWRS